MLEKIKNNIFFMNQFFAAPVRTGAICPSSKYLTRALVDFALANDSGGLIVDLGAGTGVVSRELLENGVRPDHILAIDISDNYRHIFHEQCGDVKLCFGDARQLGNIISCQKWDMPLQAIISSLPFRSMPRWLVAEIMFELHEVLLALGGVLIQYTYAFWLFSSLSRYHFIASDRKFVSVNIPPALVETYLPSPC